MPRTPIRKATHHKFFVEREEEQKKRLIKSMYCHIVTIYHNVKGRVAQIACLLCQRSTDLDTPRTKRWKFAHYPPSSEWRPGGNTG